MNYVEAYSIKGVTSKWVANSCDHTQMAAGKVAALCFYAKEIIFLTKLLLEFIRKAHFSVNKKYCLDQKFIS